MNDKDGDQLCLICQNPAYICRCEHPKYLEVCEHLPITFGAITVCELCNEVIDVTSEVAK